MLSKLAASAAATALSTLPNTAYADGAFRFSPFSRSQAPAPPQDGNVEESGGDSKPSGEESGGRSSGFDPEPLERGAKALREFNKSPYSKQVFDLMRKQEQTRLTELEAEKFKFEDMQSKIDIVCSAFIFLKSVCSDWWGSNKLLKVAILLSIALFLVLAFPVSILRRLLL